MFLCSFDAGAVLGFENLVFSVFDFITAMIESSKFRSTVKKSTDQLMYYTVLYMQITEEQVHLQLVLYSHLILDVNSVNLACVCIRHQHFLEKVSGC